MEMTKRAVASALGLQTDADLARYFDVTRSAVTQWGDDEPIPEMRQLQLRLRRPDLFVVTLKQSS